MNIPVHTLDVTLGCLKLEGKTFYEVMVAGVTGTSKATTNNRMKCSEKLNEWTAIRWTGRGLVVDTLQNFFGVVTIELPAVVSSLNN